MAIIPYLSELINDNGVVEKRILGVLFSISGHSSLNFAFFAMMQILMLVSKTFGH